MTNNIENSTSKKILYKQCLRLTLICRVMGIDLDTIVGKRDAQSHLTCSICHGLLWDARILKLCDHMLCLECVEGWKKQQTDARNEVTCPECRQPCIDSDILKLPRPITNVLNEYKLNCENAGCSEISEYSDWHRHALKCQMFIETCSGCSKKMQRSAFVEHELWF